MTKSLYEKAKYYLKQCDKNHLVFYDHKMDDISLSLIQYNIGLDNKFCNMKDLAKHIVAKYEKMDKIEEILK